MGSYKGTLQCHFKTPFTLKDTCTFQDGHYAALFWKIPVCLRAFRDIFRGHLENGQTSKKLARKTCKMFLERTKISKKQAIELKVKGGPKISLWRTCPEPRVDFVKWRHKTSWNLLALQGFFTMTYGARTSLLTYIWNYWCNLHISNANFQNHLFLLFFCA